MYGSKDPDIQSAGDSQGRKGTCGPQDPRGPGSLFMRLMRLTDIRGRGSADSVMSSESEDADVRGLVRAYPQRANRPEKDCVHRLQEGLRFRLSSLQCAKRRHLHT